MAMWFIEVIELSLVGNVIQNTSRTQVLLTLGVVLREKVDVFSKCAVRLMFSYRKEPS